MALQKGNWAVNTIQSLTNQVVGQATSLKVKFDKAALDIKTYINDTLTVEIDTLNAENVKKTGDQTIEGVKTFESSPIVPTPTTDYQASTKKYVDDNSPVIDDSITDAKLKQTGDNILPNFNAHLADNVYVTNEGVKNDGSDITSALSDLVSLSSGKALFFPDGNYTVASSIPLVSNLKLYGSKNAVIKLKDSSLETNNVFLLNNIEDVEIQGLTIDGNRINQTNYNSGTDINTEGSSPALVKITGTTRNVEIQGCKFLNSPLDDVYIRSTSTNSNINIHDNEGYNCSRTHFVITYGNGVNIHHNYLEKAHNSYFDMESNYADDVISNVIFSQNIINETDGLAVGFGCSGEGTQKNILISDNIFTINNLFGGGSNFENLTIANNIIYYKSVGSVYGLKIDRLAGKEATNLKILNNTFSDTGSGTGGCIWLRSPKYFDISKNKIINAKAIGIRIDNTLASTEGGIIKENEIISSSNDSINATIPNLNVINNKIVLAGLEGISCGASNTKIQGNTVISPTRFGIRTTTAGMTNVLIAENTITGSGNNSIYTGSCSEIIIKGNNVSLSIAASIYIPATVSKGIVSKNIIKNTQGHEAIYIAGNNIAINGNICFDDQTPKTQTYGLVLATADYLSILDNNFRNNLTGAISGTPTNYVPKPNGTFATDMANFNFVT